MNAIETLKNIGTVEELRAAAEAGKAPAGRVRNNSHMHLPPNFSAFESVEQAVDLADAQDLRLVGVTNYYDYGVYNTFVSRAAGKGIFTVFGLEIISLIDSLVTAGVLINDPNNPGRMYICGKAPCGWAGPSPRAAELLTRIRRNDTERMAEMVRRVNDCFAEAGIQADLSDQRVIDAIVERHHCPRETVTIQERHIAMAFQEKLFALLCDLDKRRELLVKLLNDEPKDPADAVATQGQLRSKLMKSGCPGFVEETFLSFEEAYELICALGGIPCYPTLADGTDPICPFEQPVMHLIDNLRQRNIHMAEFIPLRNTADILGQYVREMRRCGVAVVGGTEHNTQTLTPVEPTCSGGEPIPDDVKDIFYEGMCVAVAHQFLTAHGQTGFVDIAGNPNADYTDADARIAAFAGLGRAILQTFYEQNPR
ncbi:MAG: hypothetical protein GVY16_03620 [Planctomycetes bacterium]|jgi:hypothetical protein|nr:hypothetical protein [Planctomycetota bacterium]